MGAVVFATEATRLHTVSNVFERLSPVGTPRPRDRIEEEE